MAKKKKATRGGSTPKATPRNSRRDSRKPGEPADTKIQKQVYITQDLIDGLESLRAIREQEVRGEYGLHCSVSWSTYVGSVLHEHCKKAREAGTI
jgi:hypothetical protein